MAVYLSPGVYVKEVASGSAPIAGVGTSTAGFIGVIDPIPKKGRASNDLPIYYQLGEGVVGENVGVGDGEKTDFPLSRYPVSTESFKIEVGNVEADASIINNDQKKIAYIEFESAPTADAQISIDYRPRSPVPAGSVQLCTNFSEFKKSFGDFFENAGHSNLAHAVYGFFRNGGTRCFVSWIAETGAIDSALEAFAAIDEIALVAAPGVTDKATLGKIDAHCQDLGDRFAIFDSPEEVTDSTALKPGGDDMPGASNYVAYYYPWIKVFDSATNAPKYVPPSGHIAGVYARVDTQRGVHKAPANEVILGATGLKYPITKAKQDGLNPQGVNCIRNLNGNIRIWGARTWGGDANGEFKYVNIRRLFNYLRESIDEGTQWTVFEPNSPELWAKIRRNMTAFLTMTWRSGALFGSSPEEAFFVKCDEETNPPEVRDAGQVVTVIGVAVVKPAEFVIFEMSQWAGPGGS